MTGKACIEWIANRDKVLANIASLMKSSTEKASDKVQQLVDKNKQLEKELDRLKSKLASSAGGELTAQAVEIDGIQVLAVKLDDVDPKSLRDMVDQLKNKLASAAIVLATVKDDKVSLIAGVTKIINMVSGLLVVYARTT